MKPTMRDASRFAGKAGIPIGRYCTWMEMTPELDAALRVWCLAPRSKVDPWNVRGRKLSREETPFEWSRHA